MCRIFSYMGDLGSPDLALALDRFGKLAQDGCVPCGIAPGHRDGWGLSGFSSSAAIVYRSTDPAESDALLNASAAFRKGRGQLLAHLRKASVGANSLANTHPFAQGGVLFCHNGSIRSYEGTNVSQLPASSTDSEQFFMRILQRLEVPPSVASLEELRAALEAESEQTKLSSSWTSLICCIQTQEGLIVQCLWNEECPDAERMKLAEYYTLYVGKKTDALIVSSERLEIEGYEWEAMPNGSTRIFKASA